MISKLSDIKDFSKYQPLVLDGCTTIVDLSKFIDTFSSVVSNYRKRGSDRMADAYERTAKKALRKIQEIEKENETL